MRSTEDASWSAQAPSPPSDFPEDPAEFRMVSGVRPISLLDWRTLTTHEEATVTKSEFIERVAEDERVGSKKAAGDAVEAVLDGVVEALKAGEDVNFTGFGKFSVNERGPRQGVNPRTGERITIPGGKVPKFSAGAGLKSAVKGS
jgi:DNA-binding protein HU-beta